MFTRILLALSQSITKQEVHTYITQLDAETQGKIAILTVDRFSEIYRYDAADCILVTDRREILYAAYSCGMPHVAYMHDANRNTNFPFTTYAITSLDGLPLLYLRHVYERFYKIPWEILTTKRCRLREMTVDDVDELYKIYRDKEITRYMEDLFEDPDEEKAYVRQYIDSMYAFYGFGMWIIERLTDGKIIGRAGLNIRDGYEELELGYLIRTDEQHKGYAAEVCRAIMDYAVTELEAEALNAFIHPENLASIRLCQGLGFKRKEKADIDGETLDRYYLTFG